MSAIGAVIVALVAISVMVAVAMATSKGAHVYRQNSPGESPLPSTTTLVTVPEASYVQDLDTDPFLSTFSQYVYRDLPGSAIRHASYSSLAELKAAVPSLALPEGHALMIQKDHDVRTGLDTYIAASNLAELAKYEKHFLTEAPYSTAFIRPDPTPPGVIAHVNGVYRGLPGNVHGKMYKTTLEHAVAACREAPGCSNVILDKAKNCEGQVEYLLMDRSYDPDSPLVPSTRYEAYDVAPAVLPQEDDGLEVNL